MNKYLKIILILVCSLFLYTCDSSPTNTDEVGTDFDPIMLDVRIFLMESADSPGLTSTLDENELQQLMNGVNEVWDQANIRWEVEQVQISQALNGENYEKMLRGEIPRTSELLLSVIPEEDIDSDKWDIFLINELGGGIGGIYFPGIAAILQPETDPLGVSGLEGGLIRILAHELGHSLTLAHVPCALPGNLMAPGCPQGVRTRLTQSQVDATRNQAATNRPARTNSAINF